MSIVHIYLDYSEIKKIKEFSEDAYDLLRSRFPEEFQHTQTDLPDWHAPDIHGDESDIKFLVDLGLHPQIKRIRGTWLENLPGNQPGMHVPTVQSTVISVPNAGLFEVRKLDYIENACTDIIQGRLDKGWRIVAVCPPNDTRRPTYILGHFDKDA